MMLQTERLTLRPWRESDAEAMFEYARDPEVGPPAGWPPHQNIEESCRIIRMFMQNAQTYAICLKEEDRPIGCIDLKLKGRTDLTDRDDECEMGYWLGKPFWGRGIMPEAARELLRHAFEYLGMQKVWCAYYDGNDGLEIKRGRYQILYGSSSDDADLKALDFQVK